MTARQTQKSGTIHSVSKIRDGILQDESEIRQNELTNAVLQHRRNGIYFLTIILGK